MIADTVGERRVDASTVVIFDDGYAEWSAPLEHGGKPRLAAARMAVIVLKNALTFAATCRKAGCADLRKILRKSISRGRARAPKRRPPPR